MGILPPTTHRNQRMVSRLTQSVDPEEFQKAIQIVELAIERYAAVVPTVDTMLDPTNLLLAFLMYFTYAQLWILLLI